MKLSRRVSCRLQQVGWCLAMRFIRIHEPIIFEADASYKIASYLKKKGFHKAFIATDATISKLGLLKRMLDGFKDEHMDYVVYDEVVANPRIWLIEKGVKIYLENGCDCLIGFGGGSSMDTAKAIGARIHNPKKSIPQLKGNLHVTHKPGFIVAVATTAGTGSETTLAAVVIDDKTHHKYSINDPRLVPSLAVMDPKLLVGLPEKVTATTGMDALTHAVEAYINVMANTPSTRREAVKAVKLIHDNLELSCQHPENLEYRKNMLIASHSAGYAFTKAFVGYVHCVAHSFGGEFNVAHGLANAVILPIILRQYGRAIHKKLAKLSDAIPLTDVHDGDAEKAEAFISWIEKTNERLGIPKRLSYKLTPEQIDRMATYADKEGNPLYPCPVLWDKEDLKKIYPLVVE